MTNKIIITAIIVLFLVAAGYFLLSKNSGEPSSPAPAGSVAPISAGPAPATPGAPPSPLTPLLTTPEEPKGATSNVVIYSESGFSPKVLRIKTGTTVIFKNEESEPMWVASNPHPIHTDYSGFDARKGYSKGENYSFTFTNAGTWKYHNHFDPSEGGAIIVE